MKKVCLLVFVLFVWIGYSAAQDMDRAMDRDMDQLRSEQHVIYKDGKMYQVTDQK